MVDTYPEEKMNVARMMGFGDTPCLAFSDKCPASGCVKELGGFYRVISNKTGKLWPAKYKTEQSAKDALAAYHVK